MSAAQLPARRQRRRCSFAFSLSVRRLSSSQLKRAERGRILIDGIDISTLSLHELRKRIALVGQEATMYAGSVRANIDPSLEFDDAACRLALNDVGLKAVTLDQTVVEGGTNFSLGERQLLSLARGLLRLERSPILLLDEASSAMDEDTDRKIQEVIRHSACGDGLTS